ncbi:tetratricopeptide repeat protein [Tundrisphaera lichenicola]|uniref:tetratricopeptide repeat protein n=1 Tax=Tundrisphaera lichenicola TaxID=2029860 RepID=UPI003EBF3091
MMEHDRGLMQRSVELAKSGRVIEAEELIESALRADPDDGELWRVAGFFRHRVGNFEGARDAFETAGLLVPLDHPSRRVLAECFARTGFDELASDGYRCLALDPTCPSDLLPSVAAGLGQLGEFGPALGACLELVRREPGLPEAHFGVAYYLRRLGRAPEVVLPIVARAYELAPEVPLYRVSLATLLDHVGRREEACELIRDLDLESISCRGCLRRMATIFQAGGDADRGGICQSRSQPG